MIFAACVGLFHFANAPLLTLVAQEIGQARPDWSSVIVSVCIVGAQAVMVPMGLIVGRRAERWGRKPLLVIGFAALPVQALLYLVWRDPYWLIAVQCLDGVGAGLLSAMKPLVMADITRGTGRYNAAHGLIGTVQGAGASLSFVIAGTLSPAGGVRCRLSRVRCRGSGRARGARDADAGDRPWAASERPGCVALRAVRPGVA
ncbi:MFS transporter [Methylobacterium oryzae CBMB20]